MLILCQSLQIRCRYLALQNPCCRSDHSRTHCFLLCYHFYRRFDRIALPDKFQSLAARWVVGQIRDAPEVYDLIQQFFLAGVGMYYVIGFHAVGPGCPGDVVDVQIADGSGHPLPRFVQYGIVDQGDVEGAHFFFSRSGRRIRVSFEDCSPAQSPILR